MDLLDDWTVPDCTSPITDPFANSSSDDFELKVVDFEGFFSSQGFLSLDIADFTEDVERSQGSRETERRFYPQPKIKLRHERQPAIFMPFSSLISVEEVVPKLRALWR
jgi:hypothetical protein